MSVWLVILLAGFGSYLFRISFVLLADRVGVPGPLERVSAYVAPAAFAALAATGLAVGMVTAGYATVPTRVVPPLVAVAVAALAVHRTGKPYAALLAGMPALWICMALAGA